MRFRLSILLTLVVYLLHICSGEKLGRYIRHYDTLNYDTTTLHKKHERSRRSLDSPGVDLNFYALGRRFELDLRPDARHFSKQFTLEVNNEETQFTPDFLYVGRLKGDPSSFVHGSIINGRFSGSIYTDGSQEYHVEPAKHHFKGDQDFHSIIYRSSDLDFDHDQEGGCGAKHAILERMADFQKTALVDDDAINWSQKTHHAGENKYTSPNGRRSRSRSRRQTDGNTACNLFLQADHTYTEHFNEGDLETAISEVIESFNNHVFHVSQIYRTVVFGQWKDIEFVIDRIKVNTTDDKGPSNPFSDDYIGVEKFLELNSMQNHDSYCLAYVFADRDFNDGVLGLAWVGSPDPRTSGGICEEYKTFSGGVSQSLNTGIVTIQNYGSTVPSKVSYITFAHELGHNFGSPHDYPSQCKPGEQAGGRSEGNFIMYPSATSGDKPNNSKFSPCSISNMTQVLESKADCFVETGRPVCGNRIKEGDEECDCGYENECEEDPCCTPRPNDGSLPDSACKLKTIFGTKAQCSPSIGPCCNQSCLYVSATEGKTCRQESECGFAALCDGTSAHCPNPDPKENLTTCNNNKQVCLAGSCSGSVCLKFNLEECFCDKPASAGDVDESCHQCCMYEGSCTSSSKIPEMQNYTMQYGELPIDSTDGTKILFQQPGTPCDDYLGYCDVFYKCRLVDSNGPLSRLTKAIFNPDLYENVFAWIQEYWWATILIALGVIILMALFIKCFSVHTPSSNPNLKEARKVSHYTNTLRRRPRGNNDMQMR